MSLLIGAVLALPGCTLFPLYTGADSGPVAVGPPSIEVLSPAEGEHFDVSSVRFDLDVGGLELVGEGAGVEGQGHYHIYIDDGSGQTYYGWGNNPSETWITRLAPGTYIAEFVLAAADHIEYVPEVSDSVSFVVDEGAAYVGLDAPQNFSEIPSSSWEAQVAVQNFELNGSAIGDAHVPGQGHYHLYVDDELTMEATVGSTWITDQPTGWQPVEVRLAQNDHIETGAFDRVLVYSPEDRPGIAIVQPPPGERVGSDLTIQVEVENFHLDPGAMDGANVDGAGHYHVYVDDAYYGTGTSNATQVYGLRPGTHRLRVELAGNDHYPLEPMVLDQVDVTVE